MLVIGVGALYFYFLFFPCSSLVPPLQPLFSSTSAYIFKVPRDPWCLGIWGPWFLGALAPWSLDYLVTYSLVQRHDYHLSEEKAPFFCILLFVPTANYSKCGTVL